MRNHTTQLERMLKEVTEWEGRAGAPLSSRVSMLRMHSAVFRKMLAEVELWKGTENVKHELAAAERLTRKFCL